MVHGDIDPEEPPYTASNINTLTFRYSFKRRNRETRLQFLPPEEVGGASRRRLAEWRQGNPRARGNSVLVLRSLGEGEKKDNRVELLNEIGPGP